jgi:hypothetical protein
MRTLLRASLLAALLAPEQAARADGWQEEFNVGGRSLGPTGESRYMVLVPGFQVVLESRKARLTITVLDETVEFQGIVTRVVEEREEQGGKLYEIARNYLAIDAATGDVFYFGEDVDFYKGGKVVNHEGTWRAYQGRNRPGLLLPGRPAVGMRYYQELAPGVAMDRAEVLSISERIETPAGPLTGCLRVRESSSIKWLGLFSPTEQKVYAPGIGLVQDEDLKLVRYGHTAGRRAP